MSKLLVVFGAAGHQGSAIISYVIEEMSDQFRVRAVTRDPSKPSSKALEQKGVEVVAGDLNDKKSIINAVKGADAVFAMSVLVFDPLTKSEFEQGKAIADAAVEEKVPYLIWSTLPNAKKDSNGEFTNVKHFDEKAEVEEYIRGLPIKSSFFSPGCFMQNFHEVSAPQPIGNGAYALANILEPSFKIPFFDTDDSGKFVGALLKNPEKYEGKVLYASNGLYSHEEIAKTISKATGKEVSYKQVLPDTFTSYFPPAIAKEIVEMFQFFEKYGLYGPQTEEKVKESIPHALGKLSTLEDYFEKNPLYLN